MNSLFTKVRHSLHRRGETLCGGSYNICYIHALTSRSTSDRLPPTYNTYTSEPISKSAPLFPAAGSSLGLVPKMTFRIRVFESLEEISHIGSMLFVFLYASLYSMHFREKICSQNSLFFSSRCVLFRCARHLSTTKILIIIIIFGDCSILMCSEHKTI